MCSKHTMCRNGGEGMLRPTAMIRRLLLLEALEAAVGREVYRLREEMRQADLEILDERHRTEDVWVYFCHRQHYDEAMYLQKMLDAELESRLRRTGLFTPVPTL